MVIDPNTELGKRALERIASEEAVWLTTVDANNMPQPRPIWFLWDQETFLFYTKPSYAKLKQIARNPNVSINFDSGEHNEDLVVFLGTAAVDPTVVPADQNAAYMQKYGKDLPRIGFTAERYAAEYSVAVRVTPIKLRSF